jgi:hypothetical protein
MTAPQSLAKRLSKLEEMRQSDSTALVLIVGPDGPSAAQCAQVAAAQAAGQAVKYIELVPGRQAPQGVEQ